MDQPRPSGVLTGVEQLAKLSQVLLYALGCDLCRLGDQVQDTPSTPPLHPLYTPSTPPLHPDGFIPNEGSTSE
eukprot:508370-Prorocentrum_minimum.AAC.1